jgi:hypothetical protein
LILSPRQRVAAEALARLESRVELAHALLSTVVRRSRRVRHAVAKSAALLEEAQFAAGIARELAAADAALPSLVRRAVLACRELARVRGALLQLNEVLGTIARRSAGVRPTPGEIGDVARAVQDAVEAVHVVRVTADLVLDLDRRPTAVPLTVGDVRSLGFAFDRTSPPPQNLWVSGAVEALAARYRHRCEGRTSGAGPARDHDGSFGPADILASLKAAGLDLTHVDAGQLRPAARYVNAGRGASERAERLVDVADAFHALARTVAPLWPRRRIVDLLAGAHVPSGVLRAGDAEMQSRYVEIARCINHGPSVLRAKFGAYHLLLAIDEEGRVVRRSCRKRSAGVGLRAMAFAGGGSLGTSGLVRLARLAAALLRSALPRERRDPAPGDHARTPTLPARLTRGSLALEAGALSAAAFASYRGAGIAGVEARRSMATATDPPAIARARTRLQRAEDDKRTALRRAALGMLAGSPAPSWIPGGPSGACGPASVGVRKTSGTTASGAVLHSLALELRETRAMLERVKETAVDLHEIGSQAGVPEGLRIAAVTVAFAVQEAAADFRHALATADAEETTRTARLEFEHRLLQIVMDHRQIRLALTAFSNGTLHPARGVGSGA